MTGVISTMDGVIISPISDNLSWINYQIRNQCRITLFSIHREWKLIQCNSTSKYDSHVCNTIPTYTRLIHHSNILDTVTE